MKESGRLRLRRVHPDPDRNLVEELQRHLDLLVEDPMAAGTTKAEARAEAGERALAWTARIREGLMGKEWAASHSSNQPFKERSSTAAPVAARATAWIPLSRDEADL